MQKLVGTELYVFDLTPFEITQQTSDATVIFVQNECIDGYKELNASLADKIKGFNQFAICVTDPWAGGVEPGPEPPTPTGHTLTFDVQGIELCRITDELDSDAGGIDNPTSPVNVEAGKYFKMFTNDQYLETYQYYTITGVQATFVPASQSYNTYSFFYFVMPDEDVTLSVTYEEPTYAEVEVLYDVQDTENEIELFCAGGSSPYEGTPTPPDEMYVDGNPETVVNSWRFDSTGTHMVKFVFHSGRVSAGFLQNISNAKSIRLNEQVTQIGEGACAASSASIITSLAITPPTLDGNNQFDGSSTIYVPADYVTDYQTAWSTFASQIQALPS